MASYAIVTNTLFCGLIAALAVAPSALVVGCGSDPKPVKDPSAVTTTAATTTTPAASSSTPTAPDNPTSSSVHISDEILKACGIKAPEAFFAFDSANVRDEDGAVLAQVATCFTGGPLKGRTLQIVGHADNRGDVNYNFGLGQSRADAIKKYLQTKGMDGGRVQSTSRGAMDATGADEASYAKDRRVDLMLAPA